MFTLSSCGFPLQLALVFSCVCHSFANEIHPTCNKNENECVVYLELAEKWTMTLTVKKDGKTDVRKVSVDLLGNVLIQETNGEKRPALQEEISQIAFGDGSKKKVFLYNNSLPGPPIVAYEGQQVVLKLKNALSDMGTSVHFHGLYQENTPWMDGVTGVSQCPILPGETFTYRFLASPTGTHWYHSHYGSQRTMGAAGAFIVLPRDEQVYREIRGDYPVPTFTKEFYMFVQDWMRESSEDISFKMKYSGMRYNAETCYDVTLQLDGTSGGLIPFVSAILNGRGRYIGQDIRYKEPTLVPYQIFKVKKGDYFRFRVTSASLMFSFKISIDYHTIYLIASDGAEIKTQPMDSIIVFNAERYDFFINATDPLQLGNYWVRVETLERTQNGKRLNRRGTKGILRYDGAPEVEPTTSYRNCTEASPCEIYNCPYGLQSFEDHWACHPITSVSGAKLEPIFQPKPGEELLEYFLNFQFVAPLPFGSAQPTINGIQNKLSVSSPLTFPAKRDPNLKQCDEVSCKTLLCRDCDHRIYLPLNKIVQFTFASTIDMPFSGDDHPAHLHGKHLQVLKVAYPTYDPETNQLIKYNSDYRCTTPSCSTFEWSNASWAGGNVPGLKQQGAPFKDTFPIPAGGYVVTRLKTDSPGYWFMHCHIEFHNLNGMALILKIGNESEMNDKPKNMRTCGHFKWPDKFNNGDVCDTADQNYKINTIILTVASIIGILASIYIGYRNKVKG